MTLDEILYNIMDDYETDELAPTRKKEVCDYFISLLPKEDELAGVIKEEDGGLWDIFYGYNSLAKAILDVIKERIEKEMGNDQA